MKRRKVKTKTREGKEDRVKENARMKIGRNI